jgi:hypothetical protein
MRAPTSGVSAPATCSLPPISPCVGAAGGSTSFSLNVNEYLKGILTATGLPLTSAGENTNWRAAATAASSKPCPAGVSTSTSLTEPSASTRRRSSTSAMSPLACASGG